MNLWRFPSGVILLTACLVVGRGAAAQDPDPLFGKITVAGERQEALARLKAADRLVESAPVSEAVAGTWALAMSPGPGWLGAVAFYAGDSISRQDWAAAIEEYQRIIYDQGDLLVPIDADPRLPTRHSLPLRRLCHLLTPILILAGLVAIQVMLGVEAWLVRFANGLALETQGQITAGQAIVRTAHVLTGYSILAVSLAVALRSRRVLAERMSSVGAGRVEGAL